MQDLQYLKIHLQKMGDAVGYIIYNSIINISHITTTVEEELL